jgi:hypothetical protein
LKIAYNLKELTYQQNVKKFFFTRFKRKLFKQHIIIKTQNKVAKYINESQMELRAQQKRVYSFSYHIATSRIFKSMSFTIIIANTIVLGMTKDRETKSYNRILENLNLFFFGFFVFELITKLAGQGIKLYFLDKFNWFDSSIVVVSAIDVILVEALKNTAAGNQNILRINKYRRI